MIADVMAGLNSSVAIILQLQTSLPEKQFFRLHHNSIVNLSFVRHFKKIGRGGQVELLNGVQLDVSVKKAKAFETALQQFCLSF